MLANDQIKLAAQSLCREADERLERNNDQFDRAQLWEVVRHASHAIEAVAQLEDDELSPTDRLRRARYLVSELEAAMEAARKAKVVLDWTARRESDDF
jgi:DNA polymerase/3'-5' exonuclease PolX